MIIIATDTEREILENCCQRKCDHCIFNFFATGNNCPIKNNQIAVVCTNKSSQLRRNNNDTTGSNGNQKKSAL